MGHKARIVVSNSDATDLSFPLPPFEPLPLV